MGVVQRGSAVQGMSLWHRPIRSVGAETGLQRAPKEAGSCPVGRRRSAVENRLGSRHDDRYGLVGSLERGLISVRPTARLWRRLGHPCGRSGPADATRDGR